MFMIAFVRVVSILLWVIIPVNYAMYCFHFVRHALAAGIVTLCLAQVAKLVITHQATFASRVQLDALLVSILILNLHVHLATIISR